MRLLLRTTREVSSTEAGQELLPEAQRNLEALSTAYGPMQMRAKAQQRPLTFAHFYLPSVHEGFARTHPKMSIRLQEQPAGRITEIVTSGEAEFGVTLLGAQPRDLEFKAIRREPYVLTVAPELRLARQKTGVRDDLPSEFFLRINTQSTNRQIDG